MNTFSILIHWKSQTSLKLNCESTNRISSTLPRLRRCLATNSANLTEARTERLQPILHGKTIGSTIKTSRKEKKLVKDNEASDWLVFLLVSLSTRPRQNSSLLPFHEAYAWSAAVFHALYHYSDETGPYTQSKKGFWGIWQAYFGSLWHSGRLRHVQLPWTGDFGFWHFHSS